MADINSIRVGQLPNSAINLTDKIPHEVGTDLNSATIEELAIFIANYASTVIGVGFRAVSVADGENLPDTTKEEFILVGAGTYYNVNGGNTLVLTEDLNALISDGNVWSIGVQVPVNIEAAIVQTIRDGFTTTSPSENAIYDALLLKANAADITPPLPLLSIDFIVAIGATQTFEIPINKTAVQVFNNGYQFFKSTTNNASQTNTWTQSGNVVTLNEPTDVNNYIVIFYQ